jgi:hypothetical protein
MTDHYPHPPVGPIPPTQAQFEALAENLATAISTVEKSLTEILAYLKEVPRGR